MKVVVKGDVYVLPNEEVFEELTKGKKSNKAVEEKIAFNGEVLNKKGPSIEAKTIVMNEYSVEGVMKFMDEIYERTLEAAEKETGDAKDFLLGNVANYKQASLEMRAVLARVEKWEKEHGQGTIPKTKEPKSTQGKSPYETLADVLMSAISSARKKKG